MSNYDHTTKARMAEEIEMLREKLSEATRPLPPALSPVPEAIALAACIRAIDTMQEARENYRSAEYGIGNFLSRSSSKTGRLLVSLASKYDVELVRVETGPCERQHLDELNPERIIDAIRGGVR